MLSAVASNKFVLACTHFDASGTHQCDFKIAFTYDTGGEITAPNGIMDEEASASGIQPIEAHRMYKFPIETSLAVRIFFLFT